MDSMFDRAGFSFQPESVLSPKQKAGLDVSTRQRQVHSLAASVMFCVADLR